MNTANMENPRLEGFLTELNEIQEFYGIYILRITGSKIEVFDKDAAIANYEARYIANNISKHLKDIL